MGLNDVLLKVKNSILSDNLSKGILLISSGTIMGQIINILSQPVITRLFTPDEYGILTIFSSVLLIFRVATLSYEMAIPIVKDDEEAYNLLVVAHFLAIIVSVLFIILYKINGDYILKLLNAEAMSDYWLFIPIGILIQGSFLVFTQWMYREKSYRFISIKSIIQSVSGNGTKILLGLLNFGSSGLVLGRIITVGGVIPLLIRIFKKKNRNFWNNISLKSMYRTSKKNIDFPLYQTPSMLSTHLRSQLPIIMLAPLYGSQVVGYFGLADQIIRLPMTLIGRPVMNVFYSEIASLGPENPEQIKDLSKKLFKKLFLLGLIPMTILVILGPFLFGFVFGEEWIESGIYARILSFYVFADFIFTPVSRIYEVFRKQKLKMIIDVISFMILVIVFLLGSYFELHEYIVFGIFSFVMCIIFFTIYFISIKILNNEIQTTNKN